MDFRRGLLVILAFAFLAPGLSYAFTCSSGTLADTCTASTQTTAAGETVSGAGNLIVPSGVTLTVPAGSSLTINMGGSVTIIGAITSTGTTADYNPGGAGAAISISASSMTVSGSITSTGGNGGGRPNCSGACTGYVGGPGGAIAISAGSMTQSGSIASNGGAGGTNNLGGSGSTVSISSGSLVFTGSTSALGGAGTPAGSGGIISISAGSTVFTGTLAVTGGTAGSTAVTYGQFYSGSGAYSPKMRVTLTLKDASGTPLSGVPLTLYQEGTSTSKCSGSTGAGTGILTCDIQTATPTNLDINATGSGPKSAKLTVKFFNASDNTVDTYLSASGSRRIADLRLFAVSLKDYSGAGVNGGRLTVKNASGSTVCTSSTIKYSTLDGDAYCRVVGYSYPSAGKSTAIYSLSLDTNGAYADSPIAFNEYVARDAVINVGGAHKYLPRHTPMLFTDKTPVEIRYFPSATSQDFIFNDSIPGGLGFFGAVSLTKHTSNGSQSCSYTPSGTAFSIGSGQCAMLSSSITPGGWFELAYNMSGPAVPPNTTQSYILPAGYISYLS